MLNSKIALTILMLIFLNIEGFSQEVEETPQGPQNLNEQFSNLKQKSNTYENYKVIKISWLDQFWSNVQDSLREVKSEMVNARMNMLEQQNQLKDAQQQLSSSNEALQQSEYESSRINILGLYIPKDTYQKIVWGIIGGLVLILAVVLIKFRVNNKTTHQKKKDYEELSEEFNEYRKLVRDREIKIKRELQTERNRLEELRRKYASHK